MMKAADSVLHIENLCLGYSEKRNLLNNATASIKQGEMVALVGKNGAGKSTLLRTISATQQPLEGNIYLNNTILGKYTSAQLSKTISYVGAGEFPLENLSVYEIVSLGRHPYTNWWGTLLKQDKEKIIQSIHFVGMEEFMNVSVEKLSDGERQRVMIARALAQDTNVIILDEPTAFLDVPNRISISEVLYNLKMSGKSVLFSTHDFDTVFQFADKLWVIHEGELLEGSPEDLGLQNVYSSLFSDSDVSFDNRDMRFRRLKKNKGKVCVDISDSLVRLWSERAFRRVGLELTNEADSKLPVVAYSEDKEWIVRKSGNEISFHSLIEVTEYLILVQ